MKNPDLPAERPKLNPNIRPKENKLERDAEGKPIIELTPLEKIAVNAPTQGEYNTLMQVYECGGWKWSMGTLPTFNDFWNKFETETCFRIADAFSYWDKDWYLKEGFKIILPQEFYDRQEMTPEMIREVNEYFEAKESEK